MVIGPVTRSTRSSEPALAPKPAPAPKPEAAPVPSSSGHRADGRPRTDAAPTSHVERRLLIDPQTRQVVSAAFDRDTGELVRQVPDEALRRLQIYAHALRQTDAAAPEGGRLAVEA